MRVLFIGNSHTFVNDMPHLFKEFVEAQNKEVEVTMLTHPGMGWDYHLKQPDTRFNIKYGNYDAIVLQHTAHPMGDLDVMQQSGEELIKWVKEANSRPILYMTWTKKADGPEIQPFMAAQYFKLAEKMNVEVAEVGNNWWKYHEAFPEDEMYYKDGEHTSIIGASVAAVTIALKYLNLDVKDAKACNEITAKVLKALK